MLGTSLILFRAFAYEFEMFYCGPLKSVKYMVKFRFVFIIAHHALYVNRWDCVIYRGFNVVQ